MIHEDNIGASNFPNGVSLLPLIESAQDPYQAAGFIWARWYALGCQNHATRASETGIELRIGEFATAVADMYRQYHQSRDENRILVGVLPKGILARAAEAVGASPDDLRGFLPVGAETVIDDDTSNLYARPAQDEPLLQVWPPTPDKN